VAFKVRYVLPFSLSLSLSLSAALIKMIYNIYINIYHAKYMMTEIATFSFGTDSMSEQNAFVDGIKTL